MIGGVVVTKTVPKEERQWAAGRSALHQAVGEMWVGEVQCVCEAGFRCRTNDGRAYVHVLVR